MLGWKLLFFLRSLLRADSKTVSEDQL